MRFRTRQSNSDHRVICHAGSRRRFGVMVDKVKKKAWRLLSHEAFFKLSTDDKVAYLKAAIEQYGVYVDVKPVQRRKR